MNQSLYARIPEVMERFDFEKVQRTMEFLNWKWANTSAGNSTPTVEELESEAYRQLHEVIRIYEERGRPVSGMNVASGGFEARVDVYSSGNSALQLLFYVDCASV
jgi:hypothetical protein